MKTVILVYLPMTIPYLNQILLFLVVSVLTTVLTLSGIQVYYILKELRQTVRKMNKILEDFQLISSSVAKPVAGVSGFIMGLKSGGDLIKLFLRGRGRSKLLADEEEEENE